MKILQSKTFQFLFGVAIAATVLLIIGKLTAELWVDLVKWLGGFGTFRGSAEHVELWKRGKRDEIEAELRSTTDEQLARGVIERTNKD